MGLISILNLGLFLFLKRLSKGRLSQCRIAQNSYAKLEVDENIFVEWLRGKVPLQ